MLNKKDIIDIGIARKILIYIEYAFKLAGENI